MLIGNIENAFPICVRSILDDFYETPDDLENKVWWFYDSEPATLMPIKSINYYRQDAHMHITLVLLASDIICMEVWKWISNFIPDFITDVIYLSMLGLKLNHISKMGHWTFTHQAVRRLTNRSREITKPRDMGLKLSDRSQIVPVVYHHIIHFIVLIVQIFLLKFCSIFLSFW